MLESRSPDGITSLIIESLAIFQRRSTANHRMQHTKNVLDNYKVVPSVRELLNNEMSNSPSTVANCNSDVFGLRVAGSQLSAFSGVKGINSVALNADDTFSERRALGLTSF